MAVLDIITFLFWLLVIGLALLGGLVLVALVFGPRETERQRIAREAREAERRITAIGRQAQALILDEALRRAQASTAVVDRDLGWVRV
ncbi:MAG: hypothetical protein ACRDSN_00810 [Pseudonocardiaceae bacterium]